MSTEVDLKRTTGMPALGTYLFKIVRLKEGEGDKGKYWGYSCQVQDKIEDQGKEVFMIISLAPSARWKMDQFLDAMKAPSKGKVSGESFVGKLFRGTVSHDRNPGTGELRAGISTMFPYDSQIAMDTPAGVEAPVVNPPELSEEEDDLPF